MIGAKGLHEPESAKRLSRRRKRHRRKASARPFVQHVWDCRKNPTDRYWLVSCCREGCVGEARGRFRWLALWRFKRLQRERAKP